MASSGSSNQQESVTGPHWLGAPVTSAYSVETRICPAKDGIAVSLCLVDSSKQSEMDPARTGIRPGGWVSPNTWDSRSKSCFVRDHKEPVDHPKGQASPGYSRTLDQPRTPLLRSKRITSPSGPTPHNRPTCGRTVRFEEEPCTPCMQRKHGQGGKSQECRYKESQQIPNSLEKRLREPVSSEKSLRIESKSRPRLLETFKHCPQSRQAAHNRTLPENSQDVSANSTGVHEATITCFAPTVVGTSEKCHVVVQGKPNEGSKDRHLEMLPRLHVVHGKKTTTFGLVSPKLNRRGPPKQDDPQDPKMLCPLPNGPWVKQPASPSQLHPASVEKPQKQAAFPVTSEPKDDLLRSGIICLTGARDRSGRAVVEVYGDEQNWKSSLVSSLELSNLLLYFYTITRKEVRELGLTIVYDARKAPTHTLFAEALQLVQEQDPQAVHSVLLLMRKEKIHSLEKFPGGTEIVPSVKALHKFVESGQLTPALGGSFPYSHRDWLDLHQELHPFVLDLKAATNLLVDAIRKLEGVHKIESVQDVQQCISEQRALMKEVLEDGRLVALQREGGAMLARLRWESDVKEAYGEEGRVVMDTVEDLYNRVEEQVHVLARRSNMSLQHLHFLLQLREMESKFAKIKEWFDVEGERRMMEAESVEEPSERLQETLQSFSTFLSGANEQKLQAVTLLAEAERIQGPHHPETEVFHTMASAFRSSLSDFLSRAERCCDELEAMVNLCQFCKRATEVAKDCSRLLGKDRLQCMTLQEKQATLQRCHEKMSEFSPESFTEAKTQALSLHISRAMQVWNVAWFRCQEVSRQLEECLQDLEQAQRPLVPHGWRNDEVEAINVEFASPVLPQAELCRNPLALSEVRLCSDRDSIHGTVSCFNINFRQSRKGRKGSRSASVPDRDPVAKNSQKKTSQDCRQKTIEGSGTIGCQWFPWQHNSRRHISEGSPSASRSPKSRTPSSTSYPTPGSESQIPDSTCPGTQTSMPTYPQIQSSSRQIQSSPHAAQDCQHSHSDSFSSKEQYNEAELHGHSFHPEGTTTWKKEEAPTGPGTPSKTLKLQRVMEELLLTELDYVRSLGYILTHYVPLLACPDVPPDLRGQRGRIFGNIEKIHDFHCHFFLQELEGCQAEPLRVGRCFLRHSEQFGLYALYSKNKPQSDALIQHHTFFKRKQLELRDSMDLPSYLLKPVQRISKYSLLLQEMLGECGPGLVSERQEIQAAAEVVRFQLRHGNDLLTMDAIRDCDVNLKEQGELIRQDEFQVTFRKKRALRRVFLFEGLILFTKTKKTRSGDDVYVYKQSFKMCDIGLTQSCGDSGLCFEIWFRRRTAKDTYILQAERQDIKQAWTADLEQILWEQALKNRELWRRERMFMGVGRKAFVDIQSSEGVIQDRAVTCFLSGRETEGLLKTPNLAVSSLQKDVALPRPESIGSGSNASTSGSQSSSSSGRGSLSPSGFHGNQVHDSSHGLYGTLSVDDQQH